ncbi:hypothetical protein ACFS07_07880 [Undibacterium arcticum]
MVEQELDFKKIDQEFNVFIYRTLGKGHSITSILQYMSSKKRYCGYSMRNPSSRPF